LLEAGALLAVAAADWHHARRLYLLPSPVADIAGRLVLDPLDLFGLGLLLQPHSISTYTRE